MQPDPDLDGATARTSPRPPLSASAAPPSIADGDAAAASGDWPRAIEIWQGLLDGIHGAAASERIRWFLEEAPAQPKTISNRNRRPTTYLLLAFAAGCGLIGTALVLMAEGASGVPAVLLAAAAWLLYIASATLAVIHSYRAGRPSIRPSMPPTSAEMARARQLAESIGTIDRDNANPA